MNGGNRPNEGKVVEKKKISLFFLLFTPSPSRSSFPSHTCTRGVGGEKGNVGTDPGFARRPTLGHVRDRRGRPSRGQPAQEGRDRRQRGALGGQTGGLAMVPSRPRPRRWARGAVGKVLFVCLARKRPTSAHGTQGANWLAVLRQAVPGRPVGQRGATGAKVDRGRRRVTAMKARFCPGYSVARSCDGRCASCRHVIVEDLPPESCPPGLRGRPLPVQGRVDVEALTITVDNERKGGHAG